MNWTNFKEIYEMKKYLLLVILLSPLLSYSQNSDPLYDSESKSDKSITSDTNYK